MSTELETLLVNGITNIIRAAVLLETNKLNTPADNTVNTVSQLVKKSVEATVAKVEPPVQVEVHEPAPEYPTYTNYKSVTRSELVAKLQTVMAGHGRDTVLALFKEFNAANLSEIKESDYSKLAEMIDNL